MAHPYTMAMNRTRNRKLNGALAAGGMPPHERQEPAEANEHPTPTPAEPTKRRLVRWTPEEMMTLAHETRRIRTADVGLTPLEAVRLAQKNVMPENRQRVLDQTRQIEDITKLIRDMALKEGIGRSAAPTHEPAPSPIDAAQSLASTGFDAGGIAQALAKADAADADATASANLSPAGASAKRTLIRYTADERRTIAVESKRLLAGFQDMSRLEAIRKAIEYTMPANRQRSITTFEQVGWIADEWKAIEQQERAEQKAREAHEHAQEAERAAERARIATEAARAEAEAAKAVDPASLPFDTLIEAIGVKVAGMLLRSIGEHLQESIMQRVTEALAHVTVNVPAAPLPEGVTRLHSAPRHRKPRVLIVGLLNQQEQDMTRAMGELLTLDFAKSEHHKALEDKARNADLVVLMTKFISHSHTGIVQRVNEHIVFRNGGVSELKRWLTQWINGEVITAAA